MTEDQRSPGSRPPLTIAAEISAILSAVVGAASLYVAWLALHPRGQNAPQSDAAKPVAALTPTTHHPLLYAFVAAIAIIAVGALSEELITWIGRNRGRPFTTVATRSLESGPALLISIAYLAHYSLTPTSAAGAVILFVVAAWIGPETPYILWAFWN